MGNKQGTIEEAARKYATNQGMMAYVFPEKEKSFKEGAEWQAERMYSEEEVDLLVNELINKFTNWSHSSVYKEKLTEIYEQFKKK